MSHNQIATKESQPQKDQLVELLTSGQLLKVEASYGSAVIVCHRYYAELVGPGAIVGGNLDLDSKRIVPIGEVSFQPLESVAEKQQAYAARKEWLMKIHEITESDIPLQRAEQILRLLQEYCGIAATAQLPDRLIGQLVGTLPETIEMARQLVKQELQQPEVEPVVNFTSELAIQLPAA